MDDKVVTFKFGFKAPVMDIGSGFTGVITCRNQSLGGGQRFQVSSATLDDGKPVEYWFDADRLELIESA